MTTLATQSSPFSAKADLSNGQSITFNFGGTTQSLVIRPESATNTERLTTTFIGQTTASFDLLVGEIWTWQSGDLHIQSITFTNNGTSGSGTVHVEVFAGVILA